MPSHSEGRGGLFKVEQYRFTEFSWWSTETDVITAPEPRRLTLLTIELTIQTFNEEDRADPCQNGTNSRR
jgi:hypothetical protein